MNESKFTRGAWGTLLIVIFLIGWGAVGALYYFSLPTDGWFVRQIVGPGLFGFTYHQNLLGAPSGLQAGDHVIAVEGISLAQNDLQALSDKWRVGNTMRYTVERNKRQMDVSVTLGQWQLRPAFQFLLAQNGSIASLLGNLAFFGIAALAFYKRPGDHAARTLVLFAALILVITTLIGLAFTLAVTVFVAATIFVVAAITATFTVLFPPTLLRLALVFPRPKPMVERHPRLEYVPYLIGVGVLALFVLTHPVVGYVWSVISIVVMIGILIHSAFTMRDAFSRAQLLWGFWGVILGMSLFLSTFLVIFRLVTGVLADAITFMASLSFGVIGITLAIAILRYRLFDIGIIIRRTVTYTLVGALLAIVYFGSVILLQQLFAGITGQRSEIITILSMLAIAALFVPLRNRIQDAIDTRFNRKKYDAQKVLQKFGETVRDETDLDKLTEELVKVVQETMEPKSVSVWLKKADGGRGTTER